MISSYINKQWGCPKRILTTKQIKTERITLLLSLIGILGIDTPAESLSILVETTPAGQSGYCSINGRNGTVIAAPDEKVIQEQENPIVLAKNNQPFSQIGTFIEQSLYGKQEPAIVQYKGIVANIASISQTLSKTDEIVKSLTTAAGDSKATLVTSNTVTQKIAEESGSLAESTRSLL